MNKFVLAVLGVMSSLFVAPIMCGQGAGRETTKPPAKTTAPSKKTTAPPRQNNPTYRQPACSAQSPTKATGRTHTVNLGKGVTMDLVEIPSGSFCMGSNNGNDDQKPVHRVTISTEFYMGKYEVTLAQWDALMGTYSYMTCGRGNCPMETVTWDMAQDFINKLNEANDGFKYRLPSEAEWEYACRAGTTGDYYASDLDDIGWYVDNSANKSHPVGGKQPNAFGLYDLSGNVSEWCRDRYDSIYYRNSTGTDPKGPEGGRARVLRGGRSTENATNLRSANRSWGLADERSGFRVVAIARTQ